MTFYKRNLPHWQPPGASYFITFRLAGTLPKIALDELRLEKQKLQALHKHSFPSDKALQEFIYKKLFMKIEDYLDKGHHGPTWLKDPKMAQIIKGSLHFKDGTDYFLFAYCIMSNHVHLVFQHIAGGMEPNKVNEYPITKILASLKKYTGRRCNSYLGRTGHQFWQNESYDHVIRDSDELHRIVHYTLSNPVKANLVEHWREWPYSYCISEFQDLF